MRGYYCPVCTNTLTFTHMDIDRGPVFCKCERCGITGDYCKTNALAYLDMLKRVPEQLFLEKINGKLAAIARLLTAHGMVKEAASC